MGRMTISETLPVIAIVGPTGTGKSALAIELALRLNGECINADSMQFYRGMDIGTAKVTAEEMRGVPHHLLDIMDVRDEASVAEFQERSRELIEQIRGRGRYPILVGGFLRYRHHPGSRCAGGPGHADHRPAPLIFHSESCAPFFGSSSSPRVGQWEPVEWGA